MILKLVADHVVKQSPTCGEIREILHGAEWSPNVALAIDIGRTTAHWHATFDEIYFVLDGWLELQLYDPASDVRSTQVLAANELCVITRGVHHQVTNSSPQNRLCVITTPHFELGDEILSDRW
jgi:mannose-6-phosphate isomerase-like protein (cupin superfamily)